MDTCKKFEVKRNKSAEVSARDKSTKNNKVGEHFSVGLPFKNADVFMPNNVEFALSLHEKRQASLRKKPDDLQDCLDFMETLFKNVFARVLKPHEIPGIPGRVWY